MKPAVIVVERDLPFPQPGRSLTRYQLRAPDLHGPVILEHRVETIDGDRYDGMHLSNLFALAEQDGYRCFTVWVQSPRLEQPRAFRIVKVWRTFKGPNLELEPAAEAYLDRVIPPKPAGYWKRQARRRHQRRFAS